MPPGGSDLHSPLGPFLAYDVREVRHSALRPALVVPGPLLLVPQAGVAHQQAGAVLPSREDAHAVREGFHSVDVDVGELRRFHGGMKGKDARLHPPGTGHVGDGQGAGDVAHGAVQPELAHHQTMAEPGEHPLPGSGYDADGYRQIIAAPALVQVGGGEVYDYLAARDMVLEGLQGGNGPEEALLDGRVGQSDEVDADAGHHVDLDCDGYRIYAYAFRTDDVYKHTENCFPRIWPAKRYIISKKMFLV